MSPHEQHPELYDLPGDRRPRRIFRAHGSKLISPKGARKKQWHHSSVHINAPTLHIATRCAQRHFKNHGLKFDSIYQISWNEYAAALEKSGFKVHWPEQSQQHAA